MLEGLYWCCFSLGQCGWFTKTVHDTKPPKLRATRIKQAANRPQERMSGKITVYHAYNPIFIKFIISPYITYLLYISIKIRHHMKSPWNFAPAEMLLPLPRKLHPLSTTERPNPQKNECQDGDFFCLPGCSKPNWSSTEFALYGKYEMKV